MTVFAEFRSQRTSTQRTSIHNATKRPGGVMMGAIEGLARQACKCAWLKKRAIPDTGSSSLARLGHLQNF